MSWSTGKAAALLACVILFALTTPAGAMQAEPAAKLKIAVVKGEGVVHNVATPAPAEVVVRVEDENNQPVSGAVVVFQLPGAGPSGAFPGAGLFVTVTTDDKGEAKAVGLRPNNAACKWEIRVTVSHPEKGSAGITIPQTNEAAVVKKKSSKTWIVLVAVAGAVGGGVAAAAGGKKSGGGASPSVISPPPSSPPTPTTITIGTITVGSP